MIDAQLMLCGLAAVVFATAVGRRPRGILAMAIAFLAVAIFLADRVPSTSLAGCLAAVAAGTLLLRPSWTDVAGIAAGLLAAFVGCIFRSQGLPTPVAFFAAGLLPATSLLLTLRRQSFAPSALRDEALIVTVLLGFAVAMAPEISAGWNSATALNIEDTNANSVSRLVPMWVLTLASASAVCGGLFALWRRQ